MALDNYDPSTALSAYFPNRNERRTARLWAREKLLHDMQDAGFVNFFEGPGSNPTLLDGYAPTKVWLQVSSGVTESPGAVRRYDGSGDPTSLASWPVLDGAGFSQFLGVISMDQMTEGANTKIMTAAERGALAAVTFVTRASIASATVHSGVEVIRTIGHSNLFDGGAAVYARVVSEPSHPGKVQSDDGAWWELRPINGRVSVRAFGAKGNGTDDDHPAIQNAIDYALELGGCEIWFDPGVYRTGDTIYLKSFAHLRAHFGSVRIKLLDGADCSIIESDGFDVWDAWTTGSTDGYPMEFSIDGLILDGNAENQGTVSTSLGNLVYGLRICSHRYRIGQIQIDDVKGVGCLSEYNTTLMAAVRHDDADNYGQQGDIEGTPAPYFVDALIVQDTLFESIVWGGPADIPIRYVSTNYCGNLDGSPPSTPPTSLLFSGEEIHSFRQQTNVQIGYANLNDALYGRAFYATPNARLNAGTLIASSSWGAVKLDSSCYGSISQLVLQMNKYSWQSVYKPHLECVTGIGSGQTRGRVSLPQITMRRIGSDPDSIGPMIYDDAGNQYGIIDDIGGTAMAGHGLVVGPNSRGVRVESFQCDSLQGTASDGTASTAIMIESGADDFEINGIRVQNCDRAIVNKMANAKGIINGTITCNVGVTTGQIALEGVCAASQMSAASSGSGAVVITSENVDVSYIRDWDLTIIDTSTRYRNRFRGQGTLNTATTGSRQTVTVSHNMWRDPVDMEAIIGLLINATTTANTAIFDYIQVFNVTDDSVVVAYQVATAPAVAPSVERVVVHIN